MKRIHRSSSPRTIRLISLAVCYSLIVTTAFLPLSPSVMAGAKGSSPAAVSSSSSVQPGGLLGAPGRLWASLITLLQGGGGLPSVPGPNLPDLDAARQVQSGDPSAPEVNQSEVSEPQICKDCDPVNTRPVAVIGGPYSGTATQPISFDGSDSFDPDEDPLTFHWAFGDGNNASGPAPAHVYTSANTYQVMLTVTDSHNLSSTPATTTATVNIAPTPTPTPTPAASPTPTPTPAQTNAAAFVSQTVPTTMTAGARYPVSVTMRNTGDTTWSAAHLYRLGSQSPQGNSIWGRARVYLPTAVAPGAEVTITFTVVAPYSGADEPPPVPFQWRMVQDGVGWFGAATTSQTVTIISNYYLSYAVVQFGPFSDLYASRIAPEHRTGEPGEDLLSGNYNWGMGLVGLAGRSGLNLNLGLSYNSLAAWTKVVPPYLEMMPPEYQSPTSFNFDADRGFPSAGFRLGFPTIQGPFYTTQNGSYLMLLPSGGHVELRRVGTTNVYEAADSSYLQLLDSGNGSLLLRTTDGTQLAYWSINSEYHCTEVKDRNGNYISIKYDPINGTANLGRITSIIDTLGRTLNFNYDTNYRLQSITQLRSGQTHLWATFGYTNKLIETNFVDSLLEAKGEIEINQRPAPVVLGIPANQTVSVLTQVGLDDGSRYDFDYTSWGQVYKITHHAADSTSASPHPLSYVSYDLPLDASNQQPDCPRFTERQDWAESWNNNNPVTTNFQIDPNSMSGAVTTAAATPNQVTYKEFFTTDYSDWRRGLVTRTEIYSAGSTTPKKTTITDWTQDDTNVPYPLNPRPTATTISDADGNRRRTTVEYTAFGLPSDVYELGPYGANDWRVLRRTHTDYNLSDAYVNRRIIGLVAGQYLFAPDSPNSSSTQTLMSKTTMEYDAGGEFLQSQGSPVQYDAGSYGAGWVRGNMTSARRWDVNYENDIAHSTASSVGYNTTGSVIFSRDPLGDQTTISYTDSFSPDGTNTTPQYFATLAYPTTVTDADGYSSSAKYNYDLGAVTRQQDPKGAAQTTEYDSAGRVKRVTNAVNGAYTRFVYPTSQTIVNKFTTINELTIETYTATVFDGAGRVRAVAGDFPNSTGHYSGQFTLYDQHGRAVQSTNPTEMNSTWEARGDDLAGWISSSQTYDWKGRPLVTTNTDGTTKEASYGGCGCAGGAVVTLTDEGTMVNGVAKKRQQKIYSDSLGRTVKTEVLNWDGAGNFGTSGSVYSATVNTYNARDQVSLVREFQGGAPSDPHDLSCPSGTCQQTTMNFDGYGRLRTQHRPDQQADPATSGSTDHTTYDYNPDDTLQTVTDARGATCTYTHNARRLVTGVTHALTGKPDVSTTYSYDQAGNRTLMTDGLGSTIYGYDQLSRMTSETRNFTDLAGTSTSGNYHISYEYNLAGKFQTITDPTGAQISYTRDVTGRISEVNGSSFAGVNQYAHDVAYRAWGKLKHFSFGSISETSNLNTVAISYTPRLQITNYDITTTRVGTVHNGTNYQYFDDGRLKYSTELTNLNEDHAYRYDQAMRITQTLTGAEARGESNPFLGGVPFRQNYVYNVWSNLTQRSGHLWGNSIPTFSGNYSNDRNATWTYDASGSVTHDETRQYTYDAVGQVVATAEPPPRPNKPALTVTQNYDGDGQRAKLVDNGTVTFEVRSSVLGGQLVAEVNAQGEEVTGYVYADGNLLAKQSHGTNPTVTWMLAAPDGSCKWETPGLESIPQRTLQLDPMGDEVPLDNPYGGGGDDLGNYPAYGDAGNFGGSGCTIDGSPINCEVIGKVISRNTNQVLYNIINKRIGARSANQRVSSSNSGGSTWANAYGSQDTDDNEWHTGLDVIAEPDTLDTTTVGYNMMWFNMRPTIHFTTVSTKPQVIRVPLDADKLKGLIQDRLKYEDCAAFVAKLINKAAELTNGVKPAESTNIMALFEKIRSQPHGGILFDTDRVPGHPEVPPVAGGGGWAWGSYKFGNAMINVYTLGYYSDRAQGAARIPYLYGLRGIHEVAHMSAQFGSYDDAHMTRAAQALEPEAKYNDWNEALIKHCLPPEFR